MSGLGVYDEEMAFDDPRQRLVLTHTVLVGLTPLIPIPFVDEMVRVRLERRLVRSLAAAHDHDLSAADVRVLADPASGGWTGRAAKAVVRYPLRKLLRTAFLVLGVKEAVDVAGVCWHRAYLLDYALGEGYVAPVGPRSAAEVRAAIDAVCEVAPVTSLAPILRATFEQSTEAVAQLAARLRSERGWGEAPPDGAAADAAADSVAGRAGGVVDELAARMAARMVDMPSEQLRHLQIALQRRLAPGSV